MHNCTQTTYTYSMYSIYRIEYITKHTHTYTQGKRGRTRSDGVHTTHVQVITICDMNVRSLPSTTPNSNCLALFIVFTFNEPILMLNEQNTSHKLYSFHYFVCAVYPSFHIHGDSPKNE